MIILHDFPYYFIQQLKKTLFENYINYNARDCQSNIFKKLTHCNFLRIFERQNVLKKNAKAFVSLSRF